MFERFRKSRAARPDGGQPVADVRYAVIDTELTGLDEERDDIISLAGIHMTGGRIAVGETLYRLVRPAARLSAENVVIHEIRPSDVETERTVGAVLEEFLAFCDDRVLVGHFTAIDLAFLERDAARRGGPGIRNAVVDTYSIYAWLCRRRGDHPCLASLERNARLTDIAKCFGIPVSAEHNALADAYTTAQLFQRFLPLLRAAGAKDLADLLHLGAPFKGGDRFGPTGEIASL